MADKPDLFQKLFRKTQENLDKKPEKPTAPAAPPARPATPSATGAGKNTPHLHPLPASGERKPGNPDAPKGPGAGAGPTTPPQPAKKLKIPLTGGKLDTYATCPLKFQFTYLEKSTGTRAPSSHLAFDSILHNVLKIFWKTSGPKNPFRLDNLMQLLQKTWDPKAFESPEDAQEFKCAAENGLKLFFEKFCQTPSRAVEIDYFFKIDLFGGEYSGKMDRVDRLPDGTMEIIDYKSGKPPAGGVEELAKTVPLQLLFLAGDVIWPNKVQQVRCVYVRDGTVLTLARNPIALASAKKAYLDIGDAIYQGRFDPVRSQACPWCDYRERCPIGQIPVLNASKVRTFLECPQKFAIQYLGRRGTRPQEEPSIDLALDRPLHDALAALYRDYKRGTTQAPLPFALAAFFRAVPADLPVDLADQVKEQGREYLSQYVPRFFGSGPKTKLINEFVVWPTERFEYQTTVDRIDELHGGDLELVDYKSGKRVYEEGDLRVDPLVSLTCAAAAARWPGKVKRFSCLYLRANRQVTIEVDDALLERGRDLLNEVADRVRGKQFEALGGPACALCKVSGSCPNKMPVVSMAKIQTLRECPKRYKFRYIDRAPIPEKEKPPLLFVQCVRETLRDALATGRLPTTETLTAAYLQRLARCEATDVTRKLLEEQGRKAVGNFVSSLGGKMPQVKELAGSLKAQFEGAVLTATFDRIDQLPNGNYEVTVYKTSKKALSAHEAELDLSGVLLWIAADGRWPGKVTQVTYHYVLTGDQVRFTPAPKDIERVRLAVAEFLAATSEEEFEGNRNPLCPSCDYLAECEDAKKLLLSPSKINAFQSCPLKYKMNYIDRVPKEPRPTPHLCFDRSIHFALREFHEQWSKNQVAVSPFRGLLNKYWMADGFVDWDEEIRFKDRGVAMLDQYFAQLTGEENPVMFETSARWSLDNLDLVVQIDRIDQLPDGKLEIIDYKTGKKVPDERVINEDSTLMNLFLAANQRWPGKVAKASYIFLSAGKKFSLSPTTEDIEKHTARIRKLVQQIDTADFEANKGALCAWCEFYNPCPEWKVKPYQMAGETMEVFRKRIRLSYSKMSLYLNCPRSYKKLYLDRVPPKPQPFFSFGTTIHETFEVIYDPAHPRPRPSLEEALKIYDEVRLSHREGMSSAEVEERYRQDGLRQVTLYYNHFIKDQPFQPAHSIEDYFELPCGKYAVMTGFIDRIDKLPDGTYEILDYKTEPTDRTQDAVDHDKQLGIYYWACSDALGLKISKLSLFMLDFDKKISTTRTREDIPHLIEMIDETAYSMINEKEFLPKKNKYCKSCDHLHDCPLKDEIMADASLISMKKF